MKRLLSTKYTAASVNIGMFLLRIGLGGLMIPHGYDKLVHFNQYKRDFINFLGVGSSFSLALIIFAEFFCSMFLIAGLFTRIVVIPLLIGMCVALFKAHGGQVFGDGEHATLFIVGFLAVLFIGPGKASVDGMMGK